MGFELPNFIILGSDSLKTKPELLLQYLALNLGHVIFE